MSAPEVPAEVELDAGGGVRLLSARTSLAADYAAVARASEAALAPWLAWAAPCGDAAAFGAWMGGCARAFAARRAFLFVAVGDDGGVCGAVDLKALDWAARRGEAGVWVARARQRRGVARRCVARLCRWAFDKLGLERVELRNDARNVASHAVALACGFALDGTLRAAEAHHRDGARVDVRVYGLLRGAPLAPARRFAPPARLETERLCIEPYAPPLARAYRACLLRNQAELAQWIRWTAPEHLPDDAGFEQRMAEKLVDWKFGADFRAVVRLKATDEIIGGVGLHRPDWSVPKADCGYWLDAGHRRQGLVDEAVRAMERYGFDELGLAMIELHCDAANSASNRVAERLAYEREGVIRAHYRNHRDELRDTVIWGKLATKRL